MLLNTLIERH